MILAVQLKGPSPESNRSLRFSASPVRIGRNQLNDIQLDDPFVSEWHGIIRFTADSVAYFDLGSTNGSILDGQKLAKALPATLTEASRLQLGRIELSISSIIEEQGPSKTVGWGAAFRSGLSGPATPPPAGWSAGGGASRSGSAPSSSLPTATPPAGPRGAVAAAPGAADAAVLARYKKLVETFSEAFVGLRKGYEQFGAEVGVRTISGRTPLHRARTSRELLDYLLQPGVDLNAATKDLIAIFADFGIHHIAMMEAVTEGVRSLLQSLAPPEKKSQWKEYLERFDHAVSDDQELHAGIFGAEFARAYASVAVGDGVKSGNDRG